MVLSTALTCLALNVYFEARGEPLEGQLAVARVTDNRAGGKQEKYCDVVYAPEQFSWATTKYPDQIDKASAAWINAVAVAKSFKMFHDHSKGATHFHAHYVQPQWRKKLQLVARIGSHFFYKQA